MSVHIEHLRRTSNSTTKNTDIKDICNTNNKLFMILNIGKFIMYYIHGFIQDFGLGRGVGGGGGGGGAPSVLSLTHFQNLHNFDAHLCIRVNTSH